MSRCFICPRKCGADRSAGRGACGESDTVRVARAAPHHWEEPCLSGTAGSGTIFFSGCALKCVFCQNKAISRGAYGKDVTPVELADIMLRLSGEKVHNINLVTPSHFVLPVRESLIIAKEKGLSIPIVWNSSGYESVSSIKLLDGLVDVYLPDMKYASSYLSKRYSDAEDYFDVAKEAVDAMAEQRGMPFFKDGLMTSGVIVRHLVLPGCTQDSKTVLNYLHKRYGNRIYISIMKQYTPVGDDLPDKLSRKLTDEEYNEVTAHAALIGIENGFLQDGEAASESFIPEFDMRGI